MRAGKKGGRGRKKKKRKIQTGLSRAAAHRHNLDAYLSLWPLRSAVMGGKGKKRKKKKGRDATGDLKIARSFLLLRHRDSDREEKKKESGREVSIL